MSYRPLSPGKTAKDGSARDRRYELLSSIDLDTPFVPIPPFPCYVPTVCAADTTTISDLPALLEDNFGNLLTTDTGDVLIADGPA